VSDVPTDLRCPRCLREAQPPNLRTTRWCCAEHGEIAPLHRAVTAAPDTVSQLAARSQVPVWLPWPLPTAWLLTGVQVAGDDHSGWLATVVALSGPNPLFTTDRPTPLDADLLVVAEQPGTGLGARLAGIADVDPGPALTAAMTGSGPHATIEAAGHAVPLWSVPAGPSRDGDRAVYVGEAASVWLWLIALPAEAGAIVLEDLRMVDLRAPEHALDLPTGAPSRHLG
jgi:hypothetical protein